jgi:hypothetical protein
MEAFAKGIWGEIVDRTVETGVLLAGILIILIRSGLSWKRIMEGRWEAVLIGIWAVSALVVWHAFRSAYAVTQEIRAEEHARRSNGPQVSRVLQASGRPVYLDPVVGYSHPGFRLFGIAACLAGLAIITSYVSWLKVPRITIASSYESLESVQPQNAFAVAVETRWFSLGSGNATHYWVMQQTSNGGCALLPVNAAFFIRITNLQKRETMITSYKVEIPSQKLELIKLDMHISQLFALPVHGKSLRKGGIQWSTEPGAIGGIKDIPIRDADPSRAAPITAEILDDELGEKYLSPDRTVRGWAFFQYPPSKMVIPTDNLISIRDQIGNTFKYSIPEKAASSNEELPRDTTTGRPIDLSKCAVQN